MLQTLSAEEIDFIQQQLGSKVETLLLSKKYKHIERLSYLAEQIKARQKAKEKLPEWLQHPALVMPPALSLEQCSSELSAQYKSKILKGTTFADLSGGFGIDFYYCAKGFEKAYYVEQNEALQQLAAHNGQILKQKNTVYLHGTAAEFLKETTEKFDWVFIDPARRNEEGSKIFQWKDCSPNVLELWPMLKEKSKKVLVKASPMLDITEALRQLGCPCHVHVVCLHNEVKELLFECHFDTEIENALLTVAELSGPKPWSLSFDMQQEKSMAVEYSAPQRYLYEPAAGLLKAGLYKSVASRYGLAKLHEHTHLYTSAQLLGDFPGKAFELKAIWPVDKKTLHTALGEPTAELSIRNFPDTVANLRKKLGLKQGGTYHLFACTDILNKKIILQTNKIY